MLFGYARVSTASQNLDMQIQELKKAGCEKVFSETASGAKSDRPEFQKMMEQVREGDVIVVWKLDRLGRSLKHLISFIAELDERKVGFKSLHDPMDTTTAQGRLIFNIFASLTEFERELIRERTNAGLDAARVRGKRGGRKKGLSPEALNKAKIAKALYDGKQTTIAEIAKIIGRSRVTVYKYIHEIS